MSVQEYSARKRQLIDSNNGVWQITPPREEHIRELLSDPAGPTATAGSHPGFKDHGGSHIANPRLVIIDCGPFWNDVTKRNQFAKEVMEFGYLSGLAKYGSGNGTFWGAVTGPTVSGTVTDAQLQNVLRQLIAGGQVPAPDGHTLYALSLPDGVTVTDGNDSSCSSFCGYHSALDSQTFYSVHPSTLCNGCHGGLEPFVGYCMVLAHEIAEACTDAVPGQGWYVDDPNDSMNGSENADLEAWIPLAYGPWTVQGYYTVEAGNTIGAYTPVVSPPPQAKDYTFVDPLVKWILQNFGGHFFDAIEAMDASSADRPTYEAWRAACKQRGLI